MAQPIYFAVIHLLFASLVWVAAWLLTRSRRASATTKYWIWVVTSLYFLVPAGSIVDGLVATDAPWTGPLAVLSEVGLWLADHAVAIGAIWVVGATAMLVRLVLRMRAVHDERAAHPSHRSRERSIAGIPIRSGPPGRGPVVDGILRSQISIPDDLDDVLTSAELAAVLRHELTHARRHDNLIMLVHELASCMLWFHPLVWVAGGRLALYRELSCDESVMREARGPDLVSALAKLASRADASLLQASASSMLSHRLALLAGPPRRPANAWVISAFVVVVAAGLVFTVGHTACCFRY
jgi:beta-lactamase regulating signal transducer with metallopeptidase domain